jgi:hypothetical protein
MLKYRLGAMYEADYLREQIGLKFPSIFSMETPLAQIENESCNPELYTLSAPLSSPLRTLPLACTSWFPSGYLPFLSGR